MVPRQIVILRIVVAHAVVLIPDVLLFWLVFSLNPKP